MRQNKGTVQRICLHLQELGTQGAWKHNASLPAALLTWLAFQKHKPPACLDLAQLLDDFIRAQPGILPSVQVLRSLAVMAQEKDWNPPPFSLGAEVGETLTPHVRALAARVAMGVQELEPTAIMVVLWAFAILQPWLHSWTLLHPTVERYMVP